MNIALFPSSPAANDPKQPVFTTDPVLIAELEAEKRELAREHLTLVGA
jgi:hypothetical protein